MAISDGSQVPVAAAAAISATKDWAPDHGKTRSSRQASDEGPASARSDMSSDRKREQFAGSSHSSSNGGIALAHFSNWGPSAAGAASGPVVLLRDTWQALGPRLQGARAMMAAEPRGVGTVLYCSHCQLRGGESSHATDATDQTLLQCCWRHYACRTSQSELVRIKYNRPVLFALRT